jgi:predicted PurR-regulated permease PerM
VLIYLGFLLAARSNFRRKKSALFGHGEERREADDILTRIGDAAEKYLWVQTVTGLMIAFACWLVMVIVGLDNALFWAFFIFLTSYIPIVGPAIGCILPSIFAVVQFGLSWQPLVIFGGTQAINFTVGNLIYPRMQAQSMNIDPVVVLFSLAFWSALWGLTGAFLSTPLTVMGMVVLAQFEGTKWIAILLSENGQPLGARKPEKRLLGGRAPAKADKPAAGKSVTKA